MYVSQAASKDLNLAFPMGPFKQGKDEAVANHHQQQHPQHQISGGLLRYRSAPTTFLGEMCDEMIPHRSSSPETESLLARFMSPEIRDHMEEKTSASSERRNGAYMDSVAHEAIEPFQQSSGGFSSSSTTAQLFLNQQQPPIHRHGSSAAAEESSYRVGSSMTIDDEKGKNGMNSSNLIRHSSSPAGLFSHLGVDINGYDSMRSMSGFRLGSDSAGETALSGARLKGQISFSPRPSSSSLMQHIPEIGGESLIGNSSDEGDIRQSNGANRSYIPGFPVTSWEEPPLLSHGFPHVKRQRDSSSESQNGDGRNAFPPLSPHFSLPKTSSEMAAVLRFQDAVPCKIRAKRGCATHPRSIAERVRRTRISERMRKLQELVPNMDKQTNTADMLDLAVDYIKDLQKQVKSLSDSRASCSCPSKQKP